MQAEVCPTSRSGGARKRSKSKPRSKSRRKSSQPKTGLPESKRENSKSADRKRVHNNSVAGNG